MHLHCCYRASQKFYKHGWEWSTLEEQSISYFLYLSVVHQWILQIKTGSTSILKVIFFVLQITSAPTDLFWEWLKTALSSLLLLQQSCYWIHTANTNSSFAPWWPLAPLLLDLATSATQSSEVAPPFKALELLKVRKAEEFMDMHLDLYLKWENSETNLVWNSRADQQKWHKNVSTEMTQNHSYFSTKVWNSIQQQIWRYCITMSDQRLFVGSCSAKTRLPHLALQQLHTLM